MNKIYTAILIIALALFVSCDEKKAEDDITKAITKITDEAGDVVDKATPKPQGSGTLTNTGGKDAGGDTPPPLTKPVFSQASAHWDTPITFPKVAGYTYRLKEEKTGVTLSEATGNKMAVTATQSAQNVIIVATFRGSTIESNPIEFTRIQGNTLSFQTDVATRRGTTTIDKASKSGAVAGDTRDIKYSVSPTGEGVTIDSSSGEVTVSSSATEREYTITAELQQNEKYERSTATYKLLVSDDFAR